MKMNDPLFFTKSREIVKIVESVVMKLRSPVEKIDVLLVFCSSEISSHCHECVLLLLSL